MSEQLDYRAEYAKSDRSSCKKCKEGIKKEQLRLARMVQSYHFDGKIPNWYHADCFFSMKTVPDDINEIAGIDSLRFEDQEKIKACIKSAAGTKRPHDPKADIDKSAPFKVGYAKGKSSKCHGCGEPLISGELRLSCKSKVRGTLADTWYHLKCFDAEKLKFEGNAESFAGFDALKSQDKTKLRKAFGSEAKKKKISFANIVDVGSIQLSEEQKKIKEQSDLMWSIRTKLQANLLTGGLEMILSDNKQHIPSGESALLDAVVDVLCFGALPRCPECKGALACSDGVYKCTGNLTEWTRCQYTCKDVERSEPVINDELREYEPLSDYKYKKRTRVFVLKEQSEPTGGKDILAGLEFGYHPRHLKKKAAEVRQILSERQCSLRANYDDGTTFAILANPDKDHSKLNGSSEIPLISEEILEHFSEVKNEKDLAKYLLSDASGLFNRLRKFKGIKKKSSCNAADGNINDNKLRLKLKGGAAVDPDSGLEDKCHVVLDGSDPMSVVLGLVDVARGSNSYYKLQLLQHDKVPSKFYVFRAWGRVGTEIGGQKIEKFQDRDDAIEHFKSVYYDKTLNEWESRKEFTKVANKFYPLEIDHGEDAPMDLKKAAENECPSELPPSVQQLILMIFDIQQMQNALLEFEIDVEKMPLGKISKRQIQAAFTLLTEIQELIQSDKATGGKILDASNRFFTLIPHKFGADEKLPLLNDLSLIKNKSDMLSNLLEIEVAYDIMKVGKEASENTIDSHYKRLHCLIQPLPSDEPDHDMITRYVANTHGATHTDYSLTIEEIYKVERSGEFEAYQGFKQVLSNRMLLWHGSRVTNFAGILSQGLRIAPPEAPVTGYMFGKGLYFADMVSKSANYCCASRSNPHGLLLLCEVALGVMYEQTAANFITKLPAGKHSTKGVGSTMPNPAESVTLSDGTVVPLGTPVKADVKKTALLYNEYIVYDVNQVNLRYLVKVRFNYK